MTATFIDPVTLLPHRLGELYSDRHIMITGLARWTPGASPTDVGTVDVESSGIKIITSSLNGGLPAITQIGGGTSFSLAWDAVNLRGSSVWVTLNRLAGTQTVTVGNGITIYGPTSTPLPTESQVLVFYRASTTDIIAMSSLVTSGPAYTKLGGGTGQRIYAAIVGDDSDSTHTDLQTAINAVPTNSWILVKKMVTVTNNATINTNSKVINFQFVGSGTGLVGQSPITTGIQFDQPGCQMVGGGTITNFTYGVSLSPSGADKANCRIEMRFVGNTNNINWGTLNYRQANIDGSYGLTENAVIAIGAVHGSLARWNNTTLRWEPVSTNTINDTGILINSTIQTNTITNTAGTGAPNFPYGLTGPGVVPIGAVLATFPNLTGAYDCTATTVANVYGFVMCNGQVIADATSPMNGQTIPQINNGVFIAGYKTTIGSTSDLGTAAGTTVALGTSNLPSHTHGIAAQTTTNTGSGHNHSFSLTAAGHTLSGIVKYANGNAGYIGPGNYDGSHTHGDNGHTHSIATSGLGLIGSNEGGSPLQGLRSIFQRAAADATAYAWIAVTDYAHINSTGSTHYHTVSGVYTYIDHTHPASSVSGSVGSSDGLHTHTIGSTSTDGGPGSGTAFAILPKYITAKYIMRVK
jgi:hypothetical protein